MANIIDIIKQSETNKTQTQNNILDAMQKEAARNGRTENGALSNSTTGSRCLDYWSKCGTYRGRKQEDVDRDMFAIFSEDEETALKIVFGLRLVTRKPKDVISHTGGFLRQEFEEVQTGYGQRDEFFKAIRWMSVNKGELLQKNLHLIPVFGSWKDLLSEELLENLNKNLVFRLFYENADDELLRKYLPTIHSSKKKRGDHAKKKSQWAKEFCAYVQITHKQYRQLKKSGSAHLFQRQMSQGKWGEIDFNTVPGRAMLHLTSRKGRDGQIAFERHNQMDRLTDWTLKQDKIKFTGYPYELTTAASHTKRPNKLQVAIYNKQFNQVLDAFRGHKLGNVFCALDMSGSMSSEVAPGVTALQICLSLGLVFSKLNLGFFNDAACAFSAESKLIRFRPEEDFVTRLHFLETQVGAMGNTDFQSVIDLLVAIRKSYPNIPVEQFPETLLVVSDMQFDPAGDSSHSQLMRSYYSRVYAPNGTRYIMQPQRLDEKTNYEMARQKLASVGLPEMRVIWWHVSGRGTDFPVQMNDKGTYLIGGFDPAVLKSLMGLTKKVEPASSTAAQESRQQTPMDGMNNFLSQEIFSLINV